MRTLRPITADTEITAELLAPLFENVRKLSNLSGAGCAVIEGPAGISIRVPPAPAANQPFLAKITGRATYNFLTRPFYTWKEQEFVVDPKDSSNVVLQDKDGGRSSTLHSDGTVTDPAVEYARDLLVPTGQVVMLDDTGLVLSSPRTGESQGGGRVYGFYRPFKSAVYIGILQADLSNYDSNAQVLFYDGNGAASGLVYATNYLGFSGGTGSQVAIIEDYRSSPANPYMLIGIRQVVDTVLSSVSYDCGTGILSGTSKQVAYVARPSSSTASQILAFVPAGSDLQRIDTTTYLSVDFANVVYGQPVVLTATVTKASGTAAPTGTVAFIDSVAGPLGTADIGSGGVAELHIGSYIPRASSATIVAVYQGDSSFNGSTSSGVVMTINEAGVTVTLTASASSPTYGDTVTLTAHVAANSPSVATPEGHVTFKDGTTVIGDVFSSSGGNFVLRTSGDNLTAILAGTRSLSAVFAENSPKFATGTGTLSLVVAKKHIEIHAEKNTRPYGTPNTRSWHPDGFVNGDTAAAALTGTPAMSCAYDQTSNIGTYSGAIVISAGTLASAKYDWPGGYFYNADLVIRQTPLSCVADNKVMSRGGTVPAFTSTLSGIVNSDSLSVIYYCAGNGTVVGSFEIIPTITGAKAGNYLQTIMTGSLTVNP